jgi:hypothetical protein
VEGIAQWCLFCGDHCTCRPALLLLRLLLLLLLLLCLVMALCWVMVLRVPAPPVHGDHLAPSPLLYGRRRRTNGFNIRCCCLGWAAVIVNRLLLLL